MPKVFVYGTLKRGFSRRNPEDEEELKVYNIPEANMAKLEAEIAKLNAKAEEFGSKPIIMTTVGQQFRTHDKGKETEWDEIIYQVTVEGEPPKLAGWASGVPKLAGWVSGMPKSADSASECTCPKRGLYANE